MEAPYCPAHLPGRGLPPAMLFENYAFARWHACLRLNRFEQGISKIHLKNGNLQISLWTVKKRAKAGFPVGQVYLRRSPLCLNLKIAGFYFFAGRCSTLLGPRLTLCKSCGITRAGAVSHKALADVRTRGPLRSLTAPALPVSSKSTRKAAKKKSLLSTR